jgi:AmiR/NasT family two-component response regulator
MLSEQLGVSLQEAFARLRAHAFAAGTTLGDAAGDVVNRSLRLQPDPGPPA